MKSFRVSTGVYSSSEMPIIKALNKVKTTIFYPVLWVCDLVGVKPIIISFLSGATALFALFFSILNASPVYFICGIWLHVILDGLDGSLARFQKKETSSGALIDVLCDHIGIISSAVFLVHFSYVNAVYVLIFSVLYTFIIFSSFLLGYLNIPYNYALRPRIFVYLAITLDFFYAKSISNPLIIIFSAIMFLSVFEGLYKIFKYLK